ncbi:acyl carrier protein [Helicobacter sp. 11S02629-2]|uniref:acyl carrier protein n=1 Tax=Helicobacter sp. 11S02629-2 TaxID=1476195 RepID=UPI000BA65E5D|nr:acyl carrier protein [Helicobacter sp. 11S02629-2]PAF45729.1 acyl carrier protein [Helicobacter sp. 11S02629-2]
MSTEIFQQVAELVSQNLSVDLEAVKPESEFVKDLNADSLDVVELIMALEEKFNIEIPDEEAEKIKKVSDVVDYIAKNVK